LHGTNAYKQVLEILIKLCHQQSNVRITQEQLAVMAGVSESTLNIILDKIEDSDILNRIKAPYKQVTTYRLNPLCFSTRFKNRFSKTIKALALIPLWLLTFSLTINSFNSSNQSSYIKKLIGLKNSLLSYCKTIPDGLPLTQKEWVSCQRFTSENLKESINIYRRLKKKPKNPYAYFMGICRRRAEWFDEPEDILKAEYILHSLRENPSSHTETQKTKIPKKGTSKHLYKDMGYGLCEYGKHWSAQDLIRIRMLDKKEVALTQKQIDHRRNGHSPVVELPEPEALTRDQAITEYKDMKNSSALSGIKDKGLAEILLAFGAATLKNRIQ